MIDLQKASGLLISLDDTGMLVIPHEIKVSDASERTFDQMREFLPDTFRPNGGASAYRVYRDLQLIDESIDNGLRYDITVIPPGTYSFQNGKSEFLRTAGHYHDKTKNGLGYPEIYEVLAGRGRWVIQKMGDEKEEIIEAYLIEAGPGEKIIVPPGFGHVTINTESEYLVEANIIAKDFSYDYESYKLLAGPCYRLLESDDRTMIEIEANPRYRKLPPLMKLAVRKDWFKGYFEPLWEVYKKHEADIQFLKRPETYRPEFFEIRNLYKEIKDAE